MDELLKKVIKYKYPLLALLVFIGLFLIFMPTEKQEAALTEEDFDESFINNLETRIETIVSTIDGAGECKAMINVSSSSESVYLEENKKSYDNGEQSKKGESEDSVLTMTDSSGNQYAVVKKKLMPKISGAVITCDGGNDPCVKASVIEAVSTVLGISSNNVCVIAKS